MRAALGRRDAFLYLAAAALGGFGLGVITFYLNFYYRALGFSDLVIGALAAAQAFGAVAGALPATRFAAAHTRRTSLVAGGTVTGAGLLLLLAADDPRPLAVAAVLVGAGGILAASTGVALLADASAGLGRVRLFGLHVANATVAAFLASALAGALGAPIALALGRGAGEVVVLRALLGIGVLLAGLSVAPVLFLRPVPVPPHRQAAPAHRDVLARLVTVQVMFGFGAGAFLPFVNLFFADRFGLPFGALGIALGVIAVAGALGAVAHGRLVVPALGPLRGMVAVELVSIPLACAAALLAAPELLPLVAALLAVRAFLMYGASATFNAFSLSSFTPAERAGASALLSVGYYAAYGVGSLVSGVLRASLGAPGWTAAILLLALGYLAGALLKLRLLGAHVPRGDPSGAPLRAAPDSTA